MMNRHIHAKEQGEMAAHTVTIMTAQQGLAEGGFTSEEITSLLCIQKWYQMGVVTALRWCAIGSSSRCSFSLASWTCKKDDENG